ncbi:MAG: response regulator transcription factor [Bacteroidales bacterium]|nr:MAG: response regulator transcription factor [Bacteroidales bacterium]
MKKLKFIVVDDNVTFLNGIVFYLENILLHEVIGYAVNGKEFLDQKESFYEADIILMDVQMPEFNGIEATQRYLSIYHNAKVIAVTNFPDIVYLRELINAGFKGCVFKNRIYEDLPAAIETVRKENLYFPSDIKL